MAQVSKNGTTITIVLDSNENEAIEALMKQGDFWLGLSINEWLKVRMTTWIETRIRGAYNQLRGLPKEQKEEIMARYGVDLL
jgi:hypothetical protein